MQAEEIARQLLAIRSWERKNLPMANSLMAAEVIYLITSNAAADPVRVKDLHLTLGYSEARVRQILHALAEDGWLSVERHGIDGRMRSIRHTKRTEWVLSLALEDLAVFLRQET